MFTDAFYITAPYGNNLHVFNRGMEKQILVYSYNEILFGNKKQCTADTCNNMDMFHEIQCWMTETRYKRVTTMILLK